MYGTCQGIGNTPRPLVVIGRWCWPPLAYYVSVHKTRAVTAATALYVRIVLSGNGRVSSRCWTVEEGRGCGSIHAYEFKVRTENALHSGVKLRSETSTSLYPVPRQTMIRTRSAITRNLVVSIVFAMQGSKGAAWNLAEWSGWNGMSLCARVVESGKGMHACMHEGLHSIPCLRGTGIRHQYMLHGVSWTYS